MPDISHKILFVCIHNSGRSQMAEALLNKYGKDHFIAESAGLEPGKINPEVVQAMMEEGIDISQKGTQDVFDLYKQGKMYNAVITVCDEASAERCPVFPGIVKRIAWSFPDPSLFTGAQEEILNQIRAVRDQIKAKVIEFINQGDNMEFWVNTSHARYA
jgi:arsenate reductase